MDYYAGIDVSLEQSSLCVVDATGKIIREAKVASEPDALIEWFAAREFPVVRIGLEAGPLSQWLFAAMRKAGLAVELLETRHVRAAFKTMPVKTDRKDARGIAELMRLGWFRPVHCKSMSAQETRAVLTARRLIEAKLRDIELSLRGILRGFGLKVGKTTTTTFAERVKQLVSGHGSLELIAASLLAVREILLREFRGYEKRVRIMARHDERTRLLMTTTGVGPIISLTYVAAMDDPARFEQSKTVGAHYGMTPKKYQSGETQYSGRISKIGDKSVRTALYQAAHIILTRPVKGSKLKSWGLKLTKRVGMEKAKVAVARKLAVILHRMLVDGKPFDHQLPRQAAAA
jgi:transposase